MESACPPLFLVVRVLYVLPPLCSVCVCQGLFHCVHRDAKKKETKTVYTYTYFYINKSSSWKEKRTKQNSKSLCLFILPNSVLSLYRASIHFVFLIISEDLVRIIMAVTTLRASLRLSGFNWKTPIKRSSVSKIKKKKNGLSRETPIPGNL